VSTVPSRGMLEGVTEMVISALDALRWKKRFDPGPLRLRSRADENLPCVLRNGKPLMLSCMSTQRNAISYRFLPPQASTPEMTISVTPSSMPRLGTVDTRYSPTMSRWSRSPAAGSGSLTPVRSGASQKSLGQVERHRSLRLSSAESILRIRNCASSPLRSAPPMCASAERGPTALFRKHRPRTAAARLQGGCAGNNGRASSISQAAVDALIVTSMAISPGVRDASGAWTAEQARRRIDFTRSIGSRIAAAEFMNEPMIAAMGGAPKAMSEAYARDFQRFERFARQAAPDMIILGPGSVLARPPHPFRRADGAEGLIASRDILQQIAGGIDGFSYHHYGLYRSDASGVAETRGCGTQALVGRLAASEHGPGIRILPQSP